MTTEIIERPITYIVKVSVTRTEEALIPVVAMTSDEALKKAWASRSERSHEWRLTKTTEDCHGIMDTRGFASEWKTKLYREGKE